MMHQLRSNSGASPALAAAGGVLVLDVEVNHAFVLRPCQTTPSARRTIHSTPKQVH